MTTIIVISCLVGSRLLLLGMRKYFEWRVCVHERRLEQLIEFHNARTRAEAEAKYEAAADYVRRSSPPMR